MQPVRRGFVVDVALQGDAIPAGAAAGTSANKLRITDVVFRALTRAAAIGVLGILGGVILSLIAGSRLALSTFGFNFLVRSAGTRSPKISARWRRSTAPWSPPSSRC